MNGQDRRAWGVRAALRRWRGEPLAWLIAAGFILMAATTIATGLTVERFRMNAVENGRLNLENAVRLLSLHFDRQFDDFSVLQRDIVTEFEARGIDSPAVFRSEMGTLAAHEVLRAKASGWSDIAGANVFDADGILINSSRRWPVADASMSDRAYFRRLRDARPSAQEIEVVPSRLGQGFAIVFAGRISGPHGEFLGVVTRAIPPEQLEAFFASVGLGGDSSISIHHRNGQLLARIPHVDSMIGQNFRRGSPEQMAVFERPAFTTQISSPIDRKDRIVASRMLDRHPLVVVATNTLDATLATWRSQTKFFVAIASIMIALLAITLLAIFRLLTQRISTEKRRLDSAMDTMTQGLLMFDQDKRLVVCNRRYIEMYGLSSEVMIPGIHLRDVIRHRRDTGSFVGDVDAYSESILSHTAVSQSSIFESPNGRLMEVKSHPSSSGGWLVTHEDVTERIRAEERIARMAHHDALTDLPNRVRMREHLERLTGQLASGMPFAVLYIDVDEFKGVNDAHGHEIGDELLRHVATCLRSCAGPDDLAARLGGDEFALIKSGFRDVSELTSLAERILETLRIPLDCKGRKLRANVSIGIAMAPEHAGDVDELLRRADLAMYAAKTDGRRTFRVFSSEYDAKAKQRRELESDLREALGRDEFELHYQPLLDLSTDTVTGCEALLRWRHPVRGMVSPADFIPVAEEAGFIAEIGEWVLKNACAEAARWPAPIRVAVNVSPVQFRSRTLALKVANTLAETGLAADRLELEVTETVLIRDDEEALAVLQQLRCLGVRIALDDFGTGYSSLSYLHRFPFDKIKIDRSFIKGLGEAEDSTAIVRAVVQMAAARRMDTIAEGVETEEQREILRLLGCSQMQGYLFSPAVSPANLKTFFAMRRGYAA